MDSRRMKAKGKKKTPCKILILFICVTLYLYIHISFRHVMSYSSFCHYTIGVSLETLRPVDLPSQTTPYKKYKLQINNQHSYRQRSADLLENRQNPNKYPIRQSRTTSLSLKQKIANRPGNQQHLQQRQRKKQNILARHVVTLSWFSFQFVSYTRTRTRIRTRNGRPAGV